MSNEHPSPTAISEIVPSPSRLLPRVLLVILALIALAPTIVHYRLVDHRLGMVRYPWGLIPAHFLCLRALATFSAWLSVGILAAFAWSFWRPASTPRLLTIASLVSIVFITAYACYALFIVAVLLATRNA